MEWYEDEVRSLESARAVTKILPDPVVFYGSSSIRLWDSLEVDLQSPRSVNLGFGGSTLEACAHFFERLVLPLRPSSLVVYAGDNDLGDGRTPQQVLLSFQALSAKIDKALPGVPFTFVSIKPSPVRVSILGGIREANGLIRREFDKRPCGLFLDLFDAMLDRNCHPRPELFTADGLHMSRSGYQLWTSVFSPYRHRIFV